MKRSHTLATHSKVQLPMAMSLISAGAASEVVEDYQLVDINELVTHGREGFLLFPVTGDSMVEYIFPGDIVFVDSWAEPKNGDIIASDMNGFTCIKFFKQCINGLYLISANKDYAPKRITAKDNFRVLGVVRAHLGLHPK